MSLSTLFNRPSTVDATPLATAEPLAVAAATTSCGNETVLESVPLTADVRSELSDCTSWLIALITDAGNPLTEFTSATMASSFDKTSVTAEVTLDDPLPDHDALLEAEPLAEPELLAEADPLAEPEELPDPDALLETDPLTEAEPLPDSEPLPEIEPLPEDEPLMDVEPLPDAEPLAEVDPLAEADPLLEAEPLPEAQLVIEPEPDAEPVMSISVVMLSK
jgi:hypothetical protein